MHDKTQSHATEDNKPSQPFFARFLEGQDNQEDAAMTLKYPSDRDEIDYHLDNASSNLET